MVNECNAFEATMKLWQPVKVREKSKRLYELAFKAPCDIGVTLLGSGIGTWIDSHPQFQRRTNIFSSMGRRVEEE
jgi:hypothetical protein